MQLVDIENIRLPDDLPYKASVRRVLAQLPRVDAVPVVRCKDCVENKPNPYGGKFGTTRVCWRHMVPVPENYFCSSGKRREEDAKSN